MYSMMNGSYSAKADVNGEDKNLQCVCLFVGVSKAQRQLSNLRTFTSDSSRQLDILRHDGDSLGVDRAQVGVFEQANQVRFGRFLQGQDRGGLESQVSLEILGDFSDQSLERQLSDEQFRGLLVLADFSPRRYPGGITCGFLTPPVAGADLRAALVASCFLGALPPVDLRAVCLVRAIVSDLE